MYKKLLLFFCLLIMLCAGYAKCLYDGDTVISITASSTNSGDRSSAISASINDHTLTILFTENLGNVIVEIRNAAEVLMDFASLETPTGYLFFITTSGNYTVTFKLPNGDEYYGVFDVME